MKKENFLAISEKKWNKIEDLNELLIENFPIDILEDIGLNEASTVKDLIVLIEKHTLPKDFNGNEMLKELGDFLGIDYFNDNT